MSLSELSVRAAQTRLQAARNSPMSFVSNWYTPTRTPTVASRRVQLAICPSTGNLRGCR